MDGTVLQNARKARGWTQAEAARRLGVSQPYVALLENGERVVPPRLMRKAVRLFRLDPGLLPPTSEDPSRVAQEDLARDLSRLGYPGFAYLTGARLKNPAEVLLSALTALELESRLAEALPWLLLRYPELDAEWLVKQARLLNVTNRLGFVVDLARGVLELKGETDSPRARSLDRLADALRLSRLDVEDTFGQSLTEAERNWLRTNRSPQAHFWHLLSDWRPELLQFAA